MNVSYYSNLLASADGQALPIDQFLAGIRGGRWLAQVAAVRAALGKADKAAAKRLLPSATVSGTFSRRGKDGLQQHSGLIALDIDAEPNPGLQLAIDRKRIEADPYTYACFISAGGAGLCVLVRIPPSHHEDSFRALEQHYREELGLTIDPACKDVSRARFVSYDPALFVNEQAEVFDELLSPPEPARPAAPAPAAEYRPGPAREGYGQAALLRACDKVRTALDGQKHVTLNKMAFLCGGYIGAGFLSEFEAREALRATIGGREVTDLKQAHATIEDGLKAGQLKPVLPEPLQLHVRTQLRKGLAPADVAAVLAVGHGLPAEQVTAAVVAIKEEQARQVPLLTFWDVIDPGQDKPVKLVLSVVRFREWLAAAGFRKCVDAKPAGLARVCAQVVAAVEVSAVINFLQDYLDELPFEFDGVYLSQLRESVQRQSRLLFDPLGLLYLPELAGEFLRDTPDAHYAFYQDCWVEVTAAGRVARPYSELPGLIWESQRKPRPFLLASDETARACDFYLFLLHLTAHDPERMDQMQRALGYLVHGYKDETNARAVILMDETGEVGRSSGGTGKGLLMKGVGHMTHVSQIGAASFDFRDPFRYALMEDGARVLFLDEWKPQRNSFDLLFADITNGFAINRKYQAQRTIPFEEAPKFVLASNDIVTGDDDSSERRKVEIALAKRYSAAYTPKDDFHRPFFGKHWDADEWVRFDNLALGWVQHYLKHGKQLLLLKNASIAARGLVQDVGQTFHEFAQELIEGARARAAAGEDARIWAADAFLSYQTATGDKRTGAITFNRKMAALGLGKAPCRERGARQDQVYFFLATE
ncbi:BT4734/BF3469 family protein [Hymenobacter aquaticus]|uniref:BT4734/BF3469 family protein n=1 Tax=Hymenobacter aquaticus TaxID=1867101 RepID=UPI001436774F|nr:BT4734/BF3469 family protein [Hymenobacter aquaticus]